MQVTDRFVDDVGCLRWSIAAIERCARARDIPTARLKAVDRFAAEVTALRAAAGKWTPPQPPPKGQRPDETAIHGADATGTESSAASGPAAEPARRRMRSWVNLDDVIAGVAEAYRRASARPLKQPLHRRLAAQSSGEIPSPSVVARAAKRHGTTAAAIREAARARARTPAR